MMPSQYDNHVTDFYRNVFDICVAWTNEKKDYVYRQMGLSACAHLVVMHANATGAWEYELSIFV